MTLPIYAQLKKKDPQPKVKKENGVSQNVLPNTRLNFHIQYDQKTTQDLSVIQKIGQILKIDLDPMVIRSIIRWLSPQLQMYAEKFSPEQLYPILVSYLMRYEYMGISISLRTRLLTEFQITYQNYMHIWKQIHQILHLSYSLKIKNSEGL